MARTKKISSDMGDLLAALAEFRSDEANIRAEYARLAEEKIANSRNNVLDLMFVTHAAAGPSEIANTTKLSRSTVIRWREEFRNRVDSLPEELSLSAVSVEDHPDEEGVAALNEGSSPDIIAYSLEHSEESNEDVHVITNQTTGEKIYVIWGDTFSAGAGVDDSDAIDRPDWITDAVLSAAESATGVDIPGAVHR